MSNLPDLTDEEVNEYYNSGNLADSPSSGIGSNSGMEPDEALDGLDFTDLLKEGRMMLAKSLIQLVKTGQATPADMNNLRQLLKDNGVVMGDPLEGARNDNPKAAKEPRELPQFGTPEYDRR